MGIADKEIAVPSFRRRASVVDAASVATPPQQDAERSADALTLAEEAEAEAAEAEAAAAAARARAKAIRLRKQAEETPAGEASGQGEATGQGDATGQGEATGHNVEGVAERTTAEPTAGASSSDGDDSGAEEQVDAEPAPGKSRRLRIPRIRWGIVAAVVAILCISALVTLSVLMVVHHRQQAHEQQLIAEYQAAARQSVVTLMSLDFNNAQADVQRIIDNSTGQFKEDFEAQAEAFAQVARDSKVITEVNVNVAAVKSMTDTNATALVSATSRVTNSAGANQEPRSWRLLVDLAREGDQIKMSKVEFVP